MLVAGNLIGAGILALKRRFLPEQEPPPEQIWSLQDLRALRDSGEISEEEFETLRARVITRMAGVEAGESPTAQPLEPDAQGPN